MVHAEAEPEVTVLVAQEVEPVGVGELPRVAVRRRHRQRDVGAGGDVHARDLEVDGRDARDPADDGLVPDHLLDCRGQELGPRAEERELIGVRREEEEHDRERAAGRVVPCEEQVDQQRLELGARQPVAFLLRVHERAEQIVGRFGAPAVDELRRERVEVEDGLLDPHEQIGRHVGRERKPDRDRPLLDDLLILGCHTEHLAQHGERQHVAQAFEHIRGVLTARGVLVEQPVGERADARTYLLDLPWRQRASDQRPQPRVRRRVESRDDELPPVVERARRDALIGEHAVQRLMESRVAQERFDMLVAQDLEVAGGRVDDGPLLAQRCQRAVDVLPVPEPGGIDEAQLLPGHQYVARPPLMSNTPPVV